MEPVALSKSPRDEGLFIEALLWPRLLSSPSRQVAFFAANERAPSSADGKSSKGVSEFKTETGKSKSGIFRPSFFEDSFFDGESPLLATSDNRRLLPGDNVPNVSTALVAALSKNRGVTTFEPFRFEPWDPSIANFKRLCCFFWKSSSSSPSRYKAPFLQSPTLAGLWSTERDTVGLGFFKPSRCVYARLPGGLEDVREDME